MPAKNKDFYTYAEAQSAVQALSIKTQSEYRKHYLVDSRLPSSPNTSYADAGWIDWYDFLGKERSKLYPTYAEAQAAVQSLGIESQSDFNMRYGGAPRLPARPDKHYADAGWIDWYDFLGNKRPDFYPTYAEAQAVVQSLGIQSREEYSTRYRDTPRLPARPDKQYSDTGWTDWYDFLGKEKSPWHTYAKAQAAVQALGIVNLPDYNRRYGEDLRLPSSPNKVYADAGWIDWYDYLGNEKPDLYSTCAEARSAVQALGIFSQHDYNRR